MYIYIYICLSIWVISPGTPGLHHPPSLRLSLPTSSSFGTKDDCGTTVGCGDSMRSDHDHACRTWIQPTSQPPVLVQKNKSRENWNIKVWKYCSKHARFFCHSFPTYSWLRWYIYIYISKYINDISPRTPGLHPPPRLSLPTSSSFGTKDDSGTTVGCGDPIRSDHDHASRTWTQPTSQPPVLVQKNKSRENWNANVWKYCSKHAPRFLPQFSYIQLVTLMVTNICIHIYI